MPVALAATTTTAEVAAPWGPAAAAATPQPVVLAAATTEGGAPLERRKAWHPKWLRVHYRRGLQLLGEPAGGAQAVFDLCHKRRPFSAKSAGHWAPGGEARARATLHTSLV